MPEQPEQGAWELPEASAGEPAAPESRRRLHPGDDFRRALLYTAAGTALPGLGLLAARRRLAGGVILGLFLTVLLSLGIWAAVDLNSLASLAVRPSALKALSVILVLVALAWVSVVAASHLALRRQPTRRQRAAGGFLVGLLCFAIAAPLGYAANLTYVQAGAINKVFGSEKDTKSATRPNLNVPGSGPGQPPAADPWAAKPRLNVLLLGGDADKGRSGTRTDTVILASIDTKTGDTVLFSLPRNTTRMPFPKDSPLRRYYPRGFTDGNSDNPEFFLNAMYRNVPNRVPENVLGETDNLGADTLKLSVGAALGLNVDYYVLINLQGFTKLINALGGIRLNINTYIPIGGNTDRGIKPKEYLEPGKNQLLNGRSALWYARGRYGSDDYARMDRQRCVINAIIEQANPTNMLARYEKIAKAGGDVVFTDMPQEVLPLMVDLSLRVKNGNVRSIVFKTGSDGFASGRPNYPQMRTRVKAALGEAKAKPAPKTTTKKKPQKESEDVTDSCAYDPKRAEAAQRPR
ncbi:MAG TPA: LCP family protein [Propionibacteriaceae bacterium]|nr:LCP family protein [Propionibacteriaceae bacterium]